MPDTISPLGSDLIPINGPQAWHGQDQATLAGEWSYELTAADVAEIEAALASVREMPILAIGRADVSAPRPRQPARDVQTRDTKRPRLFSGARPADRAL